ncbi:unnamed protein product [Oncorhynchus mykiss]|uniref:Uncharacterized protein n=1 Tax=Oncorhynchus mykiss TaxID=8022 RepID=A0A060WA21_ONCMY|nr:unnamed protein product [Oncorhynchus mykiss]
MGCFSAYAFSFISSIFMSSNKCKCLEFAKMALAIGLEPVLWSDDKKNRALWPGTPVVGFASKEEFATKINILQLPTQFPDLKPIENMWFEIISAVHRSRLRISSIWKYSVLRNGLRSLSMCSPTHKTIWKKAQCHYSCNARRKKWTKVQRGTCS